MKTAFLVSFLAAAAVALAAESSLPPLKTIDQFGSLSITDGVSFFTFSKDGSFHSGPLGLCGRTFDGRWTAKDDTIFTVIATTAWQNGEYEPEDYRRIVFDIRNVQKRARIDKPNFAAPIQLFDGYFIIRELVKIPKPVDENPQ